MAKKTITVSNRLPFSVIPKKDGFSLKRNTGGVATGIGGLDFGPGSVWVGWSGVSRNSSAGKSKIDRAFLSKGLLPVFLTDEETEGYYNGFCNSTVWPLFHYFPQLARFDEKSYKTYRKVNEKFALAVLKVANKNDTIWIHDYHLMLVPRLIRQKLPGAEIGFFLHIPFPSSEIFRLIPGCSEILDGILGADLIGFHTFDYVRHFTESVRRVKRIENSLGVFNVGERIVKADMFPMGVDVKKFSSARSLAAVKNNLRRKRSFFPLGCKVILSIDRLDYTKGIEKRLQAYEMFLRKNPEWRGKVALVLVAVPSRSDVEHYRVLRSKIERMIGEINGKWGELNWEPVKYLYRSFNFEGMVSLYCLADVLFTTPERDGMNLIVKEYVASRSDGKGALILSEMAGVSRELGEAFIVNPNDISTVAATLRSALEMPMSERKLTMEAMRKRLLRYDIARWKKDFTDKLAQVKEQQKGVESKLLSKSAAWKIIKSFRSGKRCIVLLDYDGTLVPFKATPAEAEPDAEIKKSLRTLASNPRAQIVIVSGRDRKTLSRWLGDCSNAMVAEHGAWIKQGAKWECAVLETADDWKKDISSVFEIFTDRTPGSFVEEKNHCLAWHYRNVPDPSLAVARVGELNEALAGMIQNLDLRVVQGNKVIEVRHVSISKGSSIRRWFLDKKWDCVIAMGDDMTDEDMFSELPAGAYSIKVGYGPSRANFYAPSVEHSRRFMHNLAGRK